MSLQIAQNGFQFGRAGYASAMGVVLFFLTLLDRRWSCCG